MHGEGEGDAKHLSGDSGDLLLATEGQPHQKPCRAFCWSPSFLVNGQKEQSINLAPRGTWLCD